MKTALFFASFLHGLDERSPLTRVERVKKYLKFYRGLQDRLGFDRIYMSDNGGTPEQIAEILTYDADITLIRHPYVRRGLGHPVYDNLPNWRACYDYAIPIGHGYEKIIITDDDAFMLSKRFIEHIRSINSGWYTFWCPKHRMPEATISVLCKDTFPRYENFIRTKTYEQRNKSGQMELIVPYWPVNGSFTIDRYGESRLAQEPWMDAYCQCPADIEMKAEV